MLDVRAVVEPGQIADQTQPADRSPANVFDQTVVDLGLGGDHHGATGKFAVVEGEEQAGTAIEILFVVDPQRERTAVETGQRKENRSDVSELSPGAETASAQSGHIGGKAHAQQIDVVNHAAAMAQAQDVARTAAARQEGFDGVLDAASLKSRRKELPVPSGRKASVGRSPPRACGNNPLTIS